MSTSEKRAVYKKIVLAFAFLLCACIFLPWAAQGGMVFSGFTLMRRAGAGIPYLAVVGIPAVAACVAAAFALTESAAAEGFAVAAFVLCNLSSVVFLLTVKGAADAAKLFASPFYVSDVGVGFWLFFLLSFAGLVLSMKVRKLSAGYIVLTVLSVIWLFPIVWIVLTSFRAETGFYSPYFIPKHFTLNNYVKLLTDTSVFYFGQWYLNTIFVAVCTCILSTFIILCTAYVISRLRFAGRKALFNLLMVLGMFPSFMAVFAVYYIIKGIKLSGSLTALILIYSGGAALGFLVTKGFFDTIPRSLEEAAYLDGATHWQVFTRIVIPLSKPIIIYTVLLYFITAVSDFLTSSVILGNDYRKYTLAVGMNAMLSESTVDQWFTRFAAGSVLIAIPICVLFVFLQKYYVDGISGAVKG